MLINEANLFYIVFIDSSPPSRLNKNYYGSFLAHYFIAITIFRIIIFQVIDRSVLLSRGP